MKSVAPPGCGETQRSGAMGMLGRADPDQRPDPGGKQFDPILDFPDGTGAFTAKRSARNLSSPATGCCGLPQAISYGVRSRTATNSVPTGTPRAIFTRSSASNGFKPPALVVDSRAIKSSNRVCRDTNSTAPCVPNVVVPARISTDRAGFSPGIRATMA
jgi:hypothetical protein